jgi:uncharacterized protein
MKSIRTGDAGREGPPGVTGIRVAEIHIYPVKSAGGISLEEVRLDALGAALDRRWMVVDGDGTFLTQRRLPRMSRIQPRLTPDALELHAPGMPPLQVPVGVGQGERRDVVVWEARLAGERVSPQADAWVSSVLGVPAHLVRFDEDRVIRPVDPAYAPGARVGFADGYPLLLLSRGSMDELNRRLDEPVGVERFRPNLVVEGVAPHQEDRWRRLQVGGVRFAVVKPCRRCSIPAVDPTTGVPGREPLRALAGYRKSEGAIWFGQNLAHEGAGVIRVGDRVEILEEGGPRPGPEFAGELDGDRPTGFPSN